MSSTQLIISLSAGDQATAGSYAVVVTNPSPGGGASNSAKFAVNNPVPAIAAVSPSSLNANTSAAIVTITGTDFVSGASAALNGTALTTSFVSSTKLTATVPPASQIAGNYTVSVSNPAPGGGASATSGALTILPVVVGVSPAGGTVGSTLSVTVVGANPTDTSVNIATFAQAGQTFNATATAAVGTSFGVTLTVTVPSGLSPSVATAILSAPSIVSATVNGLAAANSTPFEVVPAAHALTVSPPSGEQGNSVIIALVGVSTSFDSTTQLQRTIRPDSVKCFCWLIPINYRDAFGWGWGLRQEATRLRQRLGTIPSPLTLRCFATRRSLQP